jgi:O-antigen/teichoic acid export membrane protein
VTTRPGGSERAALAAQAGHTPKRLAGSGLWQALIGTEFLRSVAATTATRGIQMGAGLVTTVIVARVLGPEGRGLFAVAIAVGALGIQATNLGLHASNTYAAAREPLRVPALLGNSIVATVLLGGVAALGVAVFCTAWPTLAPVNGTLFALALATVPLGLFYLLLQGLLLGIHAIGPYNRIEIATRILGLLLVAGVVLLGRITVVALFIPVVVATAVGGALAFRRLVAGMAGPLTTSRQLFYENLRYGSRAYLSALFSFLVLRSDLFLVKHLIGAASAGQYSIAATLGETLMVVPVVTGALLFPRLAAADPATRWPLARRAIGAVAVVMMLVTLIAFVVTVPVIRLLFGPEFLPAVPAFRWLLPGIFLISVNTIFMNFFAAQGMPWFTVISPGIASLTNITINLWAIPVFGIVGAAVASSAVYGGMLGASLLYVRRRG